MAPPRKRFPNPKYAGEVETQGYVDEVYVLFVRGNRRPDILRAMQAAHPGMQVRTIDKYIRDAKDRLFAEAKTVRELELGKAIARLDDQYRKADEGGDHRAAAQVEKIRIELLGLQAPKRIEASGPDGGPIAVEGALGALEDEIVAAVIAATGGR